MDFIEPEYDVVHSELYLAFILARATGWRMALETSSLPNDRPRQWFFAVDPAGHALEVKHGSVQSATAAMVQAMILRRPGFADQLIDGLLEIDWMSERTADDRVRLIRPQAPTVQKLFREALDPDAKPVTADGTILQPLSAFEQNLQALVPGSQEARALLDMVVRGDLGDGERERACGFIIERGSVAEAVIALMDRVSCVQPAGRSPR